MKRHPRIGLTGILFAVPLFVLGMVGSAWADSQNNNGNNDHGGDDGKCKTSHCVPHQHKPLTLKEQGNFYVGGRIELRSPNTTNAALPGDGTAPGHIAVYQANVQYHQASLLRGERTDHVSPEHLVPPDLLASALCPLCPSSNRLTEATNFVRRHRQRCQRCPMADWSQTWMLQETWCWPPEVYLSCPQPRPALFP